MALQLVRLRRALTSLSTLHRSISSPPRLPLPQTLISPSPSVHSPSVSLFQLRPFIGSRVSLSSSKRQYKLYKEGDEITEDTILFEGCDFNHWLITVDFPKDPQPTSEEMVATYERICAQGLGISIEEAKKKIYACSTTTYQGFQAVMTEEESEKFKDVPGVVFVLPDSYIDPQNKQYGGDKYENGVITPRPPPVPYRRGGRFHDRNRNPPQPRYDQQGGQMPNQRGSPQYNQQGYTQGGGRNYGPQQNYPPQQNYGPPGQRDRMPMNNRDYAPGGMDTYQANRGLYQGNYGQGQQGDYPQDQRGGPYQGNYGQGQQGGYPQDQRGGPHQGNYGQGQQGGYPQDQRGGPYQGNYGHGQQGGYPQDQRGGPYQGNYSQQHGNQYPQDQRGFRHEDQRDFMGPGENRRGEEANYVPMGQTGTNQGRF